MGLCPTSCLQLSPVTQAHSDSLPSTHALIPVFTKHTPILTPYKAHKLTSRSVPPSHQAHTEHIPILTKHIHAHPNPYHHHTRPTPGNTPLSLPGIHMHASGTDSSP
eukprot:1155972-Pelagomonas_calceolata.AAC.3